MEVRFINLEYFFNWIVELFRSIFNPYSEVGMFGGGLVSFLHFLIKVALPLAIITLFVFWVYYHIRIIELHRYQTRTVAARLRKKQEEIAMNSRNKRWIEVEKLFNSTSPGDWRLGIIEADSMLEELIVQLGYEGANLGDRLKDARARGGFADIDAAWEVHLVRNKIAHDGLEYNLIERDKKRIHNLYRQIFANTGFI